MTYVKDTLVEMGSTVTLVGISTWQKNMNRSGIDWYKDGFHIMQQNSLKYAFQSCGTVLVIHDFMSQDVGQYLFAYSSNSSKHRRVFQLELLPQSCVYISSTIFNLRILSFMKIYLVNH